MLGKLNYCWRVLGTGFCFSVFGLGGVVLSVLVFPLQRVCYQDPHVRQARARKVVHYSFRFFVALMDTLGVIGFHVYDKQVLKTLKGELVLANHPSLIDVVVLISAIPNADCVVKAHLFKNPFMRGVIKSTGYISNADPQGLLEDCERSLAQGNNLIIFPEGTRSHGGNLNRFKRGAANIALRAQCPIRAVLITMQPSTLTKGVPWYRVAPVKAHMHLQVAQEQPQPRLQDEQPVSVQSRALTRYLQTYFHNQVEKL